jgi:hypothetical protein
MLGIILLTLISINWDEIDPKNWFPLQVGNYWEYSIQYGYGKTIFDTLICRITHTETILGKKWYAISEFPFFDLYYNDDEPFITCGEFLIAYDDDNNLVGNFRLSDIPTLLIPFGELYKNIIENNVWWINPYNGVAYYAAIGSSDFGCANHVGAFFNSTFTIPDCEVGHDYYPEGHYLFYVEYNFGIKYTTSNPAQDGWFVDLHLIRANVNGEYYSNLKDANPTTWLEIKQGK